MFNRPNNPEEKLHKIKEKLTIYKKSNQNDAQIINDINKALFESRRKEILNESNKNIKSNFSTLHNHQKFTNIAFNPFIKIQGETVVSNHELIMIDPFVSLKDLPLKKNFDALILNEEEKCNTLIFIETKTSKFSESLLNQIIDKIQYYESDKMQNFIKEELKPLKIDRIEYVLLIQPHRNDLARRILIDKKIEIANEYGKKKLIDLPLIIWNLHHSTKKPNYYYLMIQPYNDNINEAIRLRQYHQNQKLIKFLSHNVEYKLFTSLVSLKFSPVLDFTYQLIMITTELLKLYESQTFTKNDLKELIKEQLFFNLRIDDNINFICQRIIKKGLNSKIFVKTREIDVYKIRMRRTIQPYKIQKDMMNKISSYKTERKFMSIKVQLELHKKILDTYLLHSERKTKTLLDFLK